MEENIGQINPVNRRKEMEAFDSVSSVHIERGLCDERV
jgi:hypothetical protein